MKDQNTPTNTLRDEVLEILRYPHNKKPERFTIATQIRYYQADQLVELLSQAVNKAEKKAWQNGWDSCQQIQIPIITSAVEIKSAQAVNKASVRIKLPHIQEFYDWCTEEDIDEEVMYKVAGWLGGEIYIQDAFIEDRIKALSGDNSEDK